MAAIRIDALCKNYGDAAILRSIDLTIDEGEFVVLVGPSGCGKSTLLRLIAGLEEITSGEIRIGGRLVNDLAPKDRDVAMVFQSYALYPHMNVRENMSFGLKLRGTPPARVDAIVQAAAEKLEIQELLLRKPRDLSGGQRQRVAMGRAMVREPQAFLFDEPLSNLDARLREQMRYEIRKLQRDLGTTSIYVTHDQIEAMTMADRIVAMHEGIAQQIGTPAELYDNPANLFVAGFIGAPAMNFLDATLESPIQPGDAAHITVMVDGHPLGAVLRPHANLKERRVILGVRPERIAFCEPSRGLTARVDFLEPTGLGTIVHLRAAEQRIKVFSSERLRLRAMDAVGIAVQTRDLLLFDPGTGRRLQAP
ncbi:MAG TPA: sn-glycerol-3-phosphate ABC transporter ATP-binding protein UgpC [Steroidobacteraceae bacterium]|jgi:multiple sugar transport system ATP-binding protein